MNTSKKSMPFWRHIPALPQILFMLGLTGGVAFRSLIFLQPLGTQIVNIVWYVGVIAYLIFFYMRIVIEGHRRGVCRHPALLERLKTHQLNNEDFLVINELVRSQCRSNIQYNYMVWFGLSFTSLVLAWFFV
ncbi:hypothetical protein COY07_01275 [Candidatus Peregrinibacteria bacterium CG_4_10_14_0_2_um_filter_43_11]|nr:MAG: hypothetical protein COY07_01275 [Candidatus Peregrinibacteria bacterium CG_4_10_14_0_2_um_filter_43_11]